MSHSHTPHYKTLDIIEFYNQVYDFVSRYLIFVLAWIFAIITILIIWIREPDLAIALPNRFLAWSISKWYIKETWLIYPVNYFAEWSLNFEWNNKILWLGWPIWRNQWMWNSIDNIVQYNGVILPRQISRSAWVPRLQQVYYSDSMIKTFLEGMWTSQADINSVRLAMDVITKQWLSGNSLMNHFGIGCSARSLLVTKFCDLKLLNAINQRQSYDLSGSTEELNIIYNYLFIAHPNTDIQKLWCDIMIQQYRYSANPNLIKLTQWCSNQITNEVQYISNMVAVNQEVRSNAFSNTIYSELSINWYKLMSWYQYLIQRVSSDQFTDEDVAILTNYNSYITKLANRGVIIQPYWDIISVFHQQYLIPWLNRRDSFAKSNEKELTQILIKTTDLIIYGDSTQGITSITSWSRIKPIDFLITQWLYYGSESGNESANIITASTWAAISNTNNQAIEPTPIETTTNSIDTEKLSVTSTTSNESSLDALISQVLGTIPTSLTKKWQLILIKYNYRWVSWFVAVDLWKKGDTQIYYDSPISGATKITHPEVIFNVSNKELIIAIMNNYLSTNPQ